ncbi:pre-rRNA-processing protein esf1 [Aristolochia californica]|uniref:pre-rRNA-processing protein esf1 n=1 Tax=Aristolochia californica TaxID=171875 RepID=UPI0035D6C0DE
MPAEEEKKTKSKKEKTNRPMAGDRHRKKKKEKEKPKSEEKSTSPLAEDFQVKKMKKKTKGEPITEISHDEMKKKKGRKMEKDTAISERAHDDNKSDNSGDNVITDPRFADVHHDPRFQRMTKQKVKVAIDDRFNRIFTNKNFSSSSAPLDKRGKPRKNKAENPLLRYYYTEEGEKTEEDKKVELQKGSTRSSSDESSSGPDSNDSEAPVSDEFDALESETSSSTSSDEDEDDEGLYLEEDLPSEKEDIPVIEQETHRLALVNMDWSHVKAVDLYVLLSSFLPKGGQLLSVAVYPSEFGLQRMEYEAKHGPADLFDGEENSDDDDTEVDNEKLRAYEKSRMRYYYAVVECNSSATADHLYKTCDGTEFERTSNVLDMRFIPDSMEFKHPPRDVATKVPSTYEALEFHTSALQQSKIHLTWEEDEPERQKIMKRKFNSKQLDELEFKEFLASDDDETDEDDEDFEESKALPDGEKAQKANKRDQYRALVQSGDGSDSEDSDKKDMEVTFNTGLEDISKKILEKKKDSKVETVWEANLRKRSDKWKAKKKGSKVSSDDDTCDFDGETQVQSDADDFFIEEPLESDTKVGNTNSKNDLPKKVNGKKNKKDSIQPLGSNEEQEATKEELELLLADEQGVEHGMKGYNIKAKKGKGKGGKDMVAEEMLPSKAFINQRFPVLSTSHGFALDPTDPSFKWSATYVRQELAKLKKGEGGDSLQKQDTEPPEETQPSTGNMAEENDQKDLDSSSKKHKLELSSLVRSIKRKVGSEQS